MTLVDDLREYMKNNSATKTQIAERHGVAIVGETHQPLLDTDSAAIRTTTSSRLVQELLLDARYRYFASEHFFNSGPVRRGLRKSLREGKRPPALEDPASIDQDDPSIDIEEIANRVLVNRHELIIDFLRHNPRYVLCIGTAAEARRDSLLAKNFLEEAADRKVTPGIPGVCLLGANHALAVSDGAQPTTRMIIEKCGYKCISIRALTDFVNKDGFADDTVVSTDTDLDNVTQADVIRLTSLVDKTPVTIPTDKRFGDKPSPFRKITFGHSKKSVAQQYEYVLLAKS